MKENLSKDPIRVRREQNGAEGDLGLYSRLNYGKIYTVENYVRVLNIGMVEQNWIPSLNANSLVRPSDDPIESPVRWAAYGKKDSNKQGTKDKKGGKGG
jgi:hypothetical protein